MLPETWDFTDFESHLRSLAFLKVILFNASIKTTDDFYKRVLTRSVLLLDCISVVGIDVLERLPDVERIENSLPNLLALSFKDLGLKVYYDTKEVFPHEARISKHTQKIVLTREMEFIVFAMIFGSKKPNINWDFTPEMVQHVSTVMHSMLGLWENQSQMPTGSYISGCKRVSVFLEILCHMYGKAVNLDTITHDNDRVMYSSLLDIAFREYKIWVE